MKNKTIITADDHPLLLKGLNDFLLEKKIQCYWKRKPYG